MTDLETQRLETVKKAEYEKTKYYDFATKLISSFGLDTLTTDRTKARTAEIELLKFDYTDLKTNQLKLDTDKTKDKVKPTVAAKKADLDTLATQDLRNLQEKEQNLADQLTLANNMKYAI